MATYTDNYQLTKPTYAEQADIGVINSNMNKIDNVMHSSQISLAPAYDQSQTYAEGDVVMYELLMYKCISPTTGAWDGSKWERTTASESGGGGSAELDILGEGNGAVVSFADGASAELAKCIAEIVPKQNLHGYSKPWAGGAGKNKLNVTMASVVEYGLTFVNNSDTSITISGTAGTTWVKTLGTVPADGTYILSGGYNAYLRFDVRRGGTVISGSASSGSDSSAVELIVGDEVSIRVDNRYAMPVPITLYPMLRLSTEPSGFEPYANICPISGHNSVTINVSPTSDTSQGVDTTIQLGDTYYGGTLNAVTGELVIDRQIVDLGTLSWARTDNAIVDVGYWFHANVSGKKATGETINSNYRTAPYKSVTQLVNAEGSAVNFVAVEAGGETGYRIIDSRYTVASDFETAMDGVQMCYYLATPITVYLPPTVINTLLGQNYVSSEDTENIDLVYVKASAPIQPNPTGTPTATLKKLGIEGTVFEVEGGGGGSSSEIHYSTTEKVVGTVEMDNGTIKPLYEKSWWLTVPSQSGGYTFPNTAMADLDQVISNEYSFGGRGMRSYTYWYSGASVVFDEHTSSGISFYFGSSDYSGRMIFYTARYTKITN